jgi:Domain of unknown function (DUF4148)
MQRIIITTLFAAGFAGAALAESPLAVPEAPFVSTATRAQVQAELAEFKRAGVDPWATSYDQLANFRSTKTREAVTAEYLASRDQVHAMNSEDSGSQSLRIAARLAPATRALASK